jgi:Zn-finger nucleic acid-binding protein
VKSISCPSCKGALKKTKLAEHLTGQSCASCNSVSIALGNYLHYLAKSPSLDEDLLLHADEVVMEEDTKGALVCDCGQIMSKYRISYDTDRKLDYCTSCQSIWMDKGEWEYLIVNNMHKLINKIFTDAWQRNIRLEGTKQALATNYEQRLGTQDYKQICKVREWIESNPAKDLLLSYLNASDPYSSEK